MKFFSIDFTLHEGKERDYITLENYMKDALNNLQIPYKQPDKIVESTIDSSLTWEYDKDWTRYIITYDETHIKIDELKDILLAICDKMYDLAIQERLSYGYIITDGSGELEGRRT